MPEITVPEIARAHLPRGQIDPRRIENRRVGEVNRLGSEFKTLVLSDGERFGHAEVRGMQSGAANCPDAAVAKGT